MAAVKSVELLSDELRPGARVRRTGQFLGRTLRWTTEITAVAAQTLDLQIVDGPMRGTVAYRIQPEGTGCRVTIRNVGNAPVSDLDEVAVLVRARFEIRVPQLLAWAQAVVSEPVARGERAEQELLPVSSAPTMVSRPDSRR